MNTPLATDSDDLGRAMKALARVEARASLVAKGRTAVAADSQAIAELQAEVARLNAENDSLRRQAAQLATRVERAMTQLDLIEKG